MSSFLCLAELRGQARRHVRLIAWSIAISEAGLAVQLTSTSRLMGHRVFRALQ